MNEPSQASSRWIVRVVLYVMLLASAAVTLLAGDWLWRSARGGRLPVWAPVVPMGLFTAFVVVYVIDRWLLVQRRSYPPVRAFFQVGIACAFLALLWPRQASELMRAVSRADEVPANQRLLAFDDPEVRAAACELAAYRQQRELVRRMEAMVAADESPVVRAACRSALERLGISPGHH
jgi:hypothetical protein